MWTCRPTARHGLALRSPLGFAGLVLAGANDAAAGEATGLVSGEAIADLPLQGLQLCVLSACESGVGDQVPVAGEGVQNLPRAFHLAGCANVVASLWSVEDRATAALMGRFYYELWQKGRPPLEALRTAQLALYRQPGRIEEWAQAARRGPVEPQHAIERPTPAASPVEPGRPRTRQWAAFVLSGVGR